LKSSTTLSSWIFKIPTKSMAFGAHFVRAGLTFVLGLFWSNAGYRLTVSVTLMRCFFLFSIHFWELAQ
jgi:hypothetical protein